MTPRQSRAARALLGLDLKSACEMSDIGKRTLTEFEAGSRSINSVTAAKLKGFYITQGIIFDESNPNVETVAIKIQFYDDRTPRGTEDKIEYVDLLDAHRVLDNLAEIHALLSKVDTMSNISQSIILYMQESLKLNQISVASIINCTPSFVSAIVVKKKNIPLNRALLIQPYFEGILNVHEVLRHEVQIKKNLTSMKKWLDEIASIWRELNPSSGRSAPPLIQFIL